MSRNAELGHAQPFEHLSENGLVADGQLWPAKRVTEHFGTIWPGK